MFKMYEARGRGGKGFESDSVYLTNHRLSFSNEVWEKCFGKSTRLCVFFEEESNRIGFKGDSLRGYKIQCSDRAKAGKGRDESFRVVLWEGFVRSIQCQFLNPVFKKLSQIPGGLWVVDLNSKQ